MNDAAAADGFVVGGDEDEAVLLVKSTFKAVIAKRSMCWSERSATAHVRRIRMVSSLLTFCTSQPPGHSNGREPVPSVTAGPLEGATEVCRPSTRI